MNNQKRSIGMMAVAIAIPLIAIMSHAQAAKAGLWEDFVTPNLDRVRSETIGRGFRQTYIGSLHSNQIAQLQASQGGDWSSSVTDWCNNLVGQQYTHAVPYLTSTWRIENGTANCYVRNLWYK